MEIENQEQHIEAEQETVFSEESSQKKDFDPFKFDDIDDWSTFKMKIENNKNLQFPSESLLQKIEVRSWNNIPIPLIKTTEIFHESLQNLCNILEESINQQKYKTEIIKNKFSNVVNKQNKLDQKMRKSIDDNHNNVKNEIIQLFKKTDEINFNQTLQQEKIEIQMQNDRFYLQDRLSRIEDTENTKIWVIKQIKNLKNELLEENDKNMKQVEDDIKNIWETNLLIPNLIGNEKCIYKNLKEYVIDQRKILSELNKKFEPYVERIIKENIQVIRNQTAMKITEVKNGLQTFQAFVDQELKGFDQKMISLNHLLSSKESRQTSYVNQQLKELENKLSEEIENQGKNFNEDLVSKTINLDLKIVDNFNRLQESIQNINEQNESKHTEDQKELKFLLQDLERKCQTFAKVEIKRYDDQERKKKENISRSSKKGSKQTTVLKNPSSFADATSEQVNKLFKRAGSKIDSSNTDQQLIKKIQSPQSVNLNQNRALTSINIQQSLKEIIKPPESVNLEKEDQLNLKTIKSIDEVEDQEVKQASESSKNQQKTIKIDQQKEEVSNQSPNQQMPIQSENKLKSEPIQQQQQQLETQESKEEKIQSQSQQKIDLKEIENLIQEKLSDYFQNLFSQKKLSKQDSLNINDKLQNLKELLESFINDMIDNKLNEYFQKSEQLDPSLLAILKAYNINLPTKIQSDHNALSKDIKQIIQEKKIVVELSKVQNHNDFKENLNQNIHFTKKKFTADSIQSRFQDKYTFKSQNQIKIEDYTSQNLQLNNIKENLTDKKYDQIQQQGYDEELLNDLFKDENKISPSNISRNNIQTNQSQNKSFEKQSQGKTYIQIKQNQGQTLKDFSRPLSNNSIESLQQFQLHDYSVVNGRIQANSNFYETHSSQNLRRVSSTKNQIQDIKKQQIDERLQDKNNYFLASQSLLGQKYSIKSNMLKNQDKSNNISIKNRDGYKFGEENYSNDLSKNMVIKSFSKEKYKLNDKIPQLHGYQSQFQTHRNIENKKIIKFETLEELQKSFNINSGFKNELGLTVSQTGMMTNSDIPGYFGSLLKNQNITTHRHYFKENRNLNESEINSQLINKNNYSKPFIVNRGLGSNFKGKNTNQIIQKEDILSKNRSMITSEKALKQYQNLTQFERINI